MSKNIVIQEGGTGKNLTVDKLKTNLVGGGSCLWVPEDGTTLGTKYINADGTYKASTDGYYGYSEVTVSGIGSATGKDSDGDDATATVDPETGDLIITKDAYSIAVVTPPTVTTYRDGFTIDFSGMVVKAYIKSGELWTDASHPDGVIQISELTLPVTTADAGGAPTDEWSDGQGVNATLISYTPHWDRDEIGNEWQLYLSQVISTHNGHPAMWGADNPGGGPTQFFATIYDGGLYTWGATSAQKMNAFEDLGTPYHRYDMFSGSSATPSTGAVVQTGSAEGLQNIAVSTVRPQGTPSLEPVGTTQTIPVQWSRSGDEKLLESNFEIVVTG